MEAFIGGWEEENANRSEEVEKLLDSRKDLNEETKEIYRNSKSTYKIAKDGDKYSFTATSTAFPGKQKTETFYLGKPFEGQALDDGNFKATITVENNVMIEIGNHEKWGDYKVTRKVNSNEMEILVEISGTKIPSKMKKIH